MGAGGITNTELYNGTVWTNNPSGLGTGRYTSRGVGSQNAAITAGGWGAASSGANLSATELWTGVALKTKTITVS
jgi:hypothetical protein